MPWLEWALRKSNLLNTSEWFEWCLMGLQRPCSPVAFLPNPTLSQLFLPGFLWACHPHSPTPRPPHGFLPSPWTSVQASSGPDNAARSAHSAYKVSTPSTSRWCFPPLLQTWLISASREPSLNLLCPGPVATELGPILRGPTSPLQTMYVLAECKSNISVTCDLNSRNAICISRDGLQLLVDFSFFFFNLFISKYF